MDASTFVQWKGTSLCMDLHCTCGYHSHLDGYFAYHVRCPNCGAVYKMPEDLPLERVDPADGDLVLMDASEAIVRDGETIGSMGGSVEGTWGEIKKIKPYVQARAEEHGA